MDATQNLCREMSHLGMTGPALIVAGNSARTILQDTWKKTFAEEGCSLGVHNF
jgi:glycerol dehydrogenase